MHPLIRRAVNPNRARQLLRPNIRHYEARPRWARKYEDAFDPRVRFTIAMVGSCAVWYGLIQTEWLVGSSFVLQIFGVK